MTRVFVVGGGVAGLTAATTLGAAGLEVTVLESASRPGGRMITDRLDGYVIDAGAQFLNAGYRTLLPLLHEVGLGPALARPNRDHLSVRGGRIFRYDRKDPISVWRSGYLSTPTLMRLWRWRRQMRRLHAQLDSADYSRYSAWDGEAFDRYIHRTCGRQALDYFFQPIVSGFYYYEPARTSAAVAYVLAGLGPFPVLTLAGGIGRLTETLADRVPVVLGARVRAVRRVGPGVGLVIEGRDGRTETVSADAAVLATPGVVTREILEGPTEREARLLESIGYSTCVNVALGTSRRFGEDAYGTLLSGREFKVVSAFTFETGKHPDRAPVDGDLMMAMTTGAAGTQLIDQPDEVIVRVVAGELEPVLPGITKALVFHRVYRWRHAIALSPPGRARALAEFRAARQPGDPITLCGDYTACPYTEGALWSGVRAAQDLLGQDAHRACA